MSIWFDSRDLRYKDPFGAVSCGAEVRLLWGATSWRRSAVCWCGRNLPGWSNSPSPPPAMAYGRADGAGGAGADLVRASGCGGPTAPPLAGTQWLRRLRRTVSHGS